MKTQLTFNADDVLKATALIYLAEALQDQRYEECAELVAEARGLGAQPAEISAILGGHAKGLTTKFDEAAPKGRLRF